MNFVYEELFVSDNDIAQRAQEVVSLAKEAGVRVTCAESCTGGLVAGAITSVDGSSAVFDGSFVTYANRIKTQYVGVPEEVLATVGAVSSETAEQMARGVRKAFGVDIAVSITGIAGPQGGSETKPVGTVWFGLNSDKIMRTEKHLFKGDRAQVRAASVYTALGLLLEGIRKASE